MCCSENDGCALFLNFVVAREQNWRAILLWKPYCMAPVCIFVHIGCVLYEWTNTGLLQQYWLLSHLSELEGTPRLMKKAKTKLIKNHFKNMF